MILRVLAWVIVAPILAESFLTRPSPPLLPSSSTRLAIFGGGGGKIPSSPADRYVILIFVCYSQRANIFKWKNLSLCGPPKSDNQAISALKAAIANPKTKSFPLIECEFPPLVALNKLGDGSMRSANEVDQVRERLEKEDVEMLLDGWEIFLVPFFVG